MKELIIRETSKLAYDFISKSVDIDNPDNLVVSTTTAFNIEMQPKSVYESIVNLKPANDIRRINKFFEAVNAKLDNEGIFISCAETYSLRKKRVLNKYPKGINWFMYSILSLVGMKVSILCIASLGHSTIFIISKVLLF